MSNEASAWFQEQWNTQVIHVYQQKGYLTKGMSVGPTKVVGKKLHFNIAGKGVAQDYTRGDRVKLMNASRGEVTLDASEYDAAEYIYQYDLDRMQPNEVDAARETAAKALGRKHDEVLYNKMQATDFNALGQVSGAFTDPAGPSQILAARRALFARDVPVEDGENFCGLPPIAFDTMMSYEVFANSQWVGGDLPFANGLRRRSWQNINFFELPVHLQKNSGTDGTFYMWNRSALGTGYTGEEMRTGFKWELEYKRWYYQSTLSAGSTIIQAAGIQEIRFKNDTLPTFT